MQSKATTVKQYLAELPAERRPAIEAVRGVILENLDKDYEEGMYYGMICYFVPHRIYPAGYHCDPRIPLPFAGLASQKQYMSLYLMTDQGEGEWLRKAWAKTGKKLDMGKCCIRFKRLDDLPLDLVGKAVRRVPARKYIRLVEAARQAAGPRPPAKASPRSARRKPAAKAAKPGVRAAGAKAVNSAKR